MIGFLNILKPPNMTSHDVVNFVRKNLNVKKVGHSGTLDPMATGVLPICIGKATKLIEFMQNDTKTYRAELTLGIVTDTQDRWGNILDTVNVNVSEEKIFEVFNSFKGEKTQIPPMYSALKYKGKKLYELARQGITVERKPRKIYIYDISIIDINANKILFDVNCSKGTYIRTLCHDIGMALGCGGHMSFLARLRSGYFNLDDSLTLEEITALDKDILEKQYIYKLDYPIKYLPRVDVKQFALRFLLNGVALQKKAFTLNSNIKNGSIVRLYVNNTFKAIGIYKKNNKHSIIQIKKLFS
ncbi:tRNA pseudouridine(55) synthase TruB [Caminicella sporogenes]|uniref:tRNA pseudouridine(55) synthase TruB n=1 Tax=Caminicella sporogenes TaxID=166485 RepID=UPI00254149CE|nr:tRNA pseudouridine(55) synthase TruB [Caminicella sporogenes]WIF96200.1 tRNA pseudouridine(55) synthase TruB [Caminicella sporogenes]